MPVSALPKSLTDPVLDKDGNEVGRKAKKHWDYPWPFNKISRGATAYKWGKPKLVVGKAEMVDGAPKPINPAGTFQVSHFPDAPWWAKPFAWYVSVSGKRSEKDGRFRNFRLGTRWDDVDDYANCTFIPLPSSRRFTGGDDQDTSTNK